MFEFRFANPAALNLLVLVPLLLILLWAMSKRTQAVLQSAFASKVTNYLIRSLSLSRRRLKTTLQVLALFFFVMALARPQSGEGRQKAKSEGLEIVLAVDVSNSMLAEDVRPSRLELAQKELSRFIDSLGNDKIGLVAFAGSAVLLSPLTTDKSALKMFIESLSPEAVSTQGTDFKKAISEAYQALHRGGLGEDSEDPNVARVIVIASDGEENEKGGLDAAQKVANEGIRIFTLGFGTEAGGQIPVRDKHGQLVGYKKDRNGQVVITKSTGQALRELADAGKGSYQHVTFGSDAVLNLKAEIDRLQRAQLDTMEFTHYNEHYQSFLLLGLLLAMIELALGERKGEGRLWRGRFEVPLD